MQARHLHIFTLCWAAPPDRAPSPLHPHSIPKEETLSVWNEEPLTQVKLMLLESLVGSRHYPIWATEKDRRELGKAPCLLLLLVLSRSETLPTFPLGA